MEEREIRWNYLEICGNKRNGALEWWSDGRNGSWFVVLGSLLLRTECTLDGVPTPQWLCYGGRVGCRLRDQRIPFQGAGAVNVYQEPHKPWG